jgi:hypothetical protein
VISVVTNFFWCVVGFLQSYNGAVTAIATLSIGAFTFALVCVTNRQAKLTKESVEIANRALNELEAPFISIKIVSPGLQWNVAKTQLNFGTLTFTYANYGRTPAIIFEGFEDVRGVDVGSGFPPPIEGERGPPMPWGVIAAPNGGDSGPFRVNIFAHMLGIADGNPLELKNKAVFFLGFVKYGDIFGSVYTQGFCFLFDDIGNRFIEAGDEKYSYRHKETGPYQPPGKSNLV